MQLTYTKHTHVYLCYKCINLSYLDTHNLPKVEKMLCKYWEYYTLLNKSSTMCFISTVVCTAEQNVHTLNIFMSLCYIAICLLKCCILRTT